MISLPPFGVLTSDQVIPMSGEGVPDGMHSGTCLTCDGVSGPYGGDPRPVYTWMREHARAHGHSAFTVTAECHWRVHALIPASGDAPREVQPLYPLPSIDETVEPVNCWWCSGPTRTPIFLHVERPQGVGGFAYACLACTRRAARDHLGQCDTCDLGAEKGSVCGVFEAYVFALSMRLDAEDIF